MTEHATFADALFLLVSAVCGYSPFVFVIWLLGGFRKDGK